MGNGILGAVGNPRDMMLMFTGSGKVDHLNDDQLKKLLATSDTKKPFLDKVIDEMIKRLEGKISSGQTGAGEERQVELLRKLKDGSITEDEHHELGEHLSIKLPPRSSKDGQSNQV